MAPKKFDTLAARHFGEFLSSHDFTSRGSKHSTFWRELPGEVFHFIVPDPRRYANTYEVKVYFSSPHIDPNFVSNFPDSLGIPTDMFCELKAKEGITQGGSRFPCKDDVAFAKGFEQAVKPALLEIALPYLGEITNVERMLQLARHPYFTRKADG